jgi:ring-1,2-phenylacetyl-CoA epoxidase subunit PaaD
MVVADAWALLGTLMDPEVPVVSLVELGVIRDVAKADGHWRVTMTPTYSGCPAMDVMAADIRAAFAAHGGAAEVVTTLSPAWTTDWMAPEARSRLHDYGIAPPHAVAARDSGGVRIDISGLGRARDGGEAIACPNCGSASTTRLSQFGSTACKALYRCDECREPFDYFKPH